MASLTWRPPSEDGFHQQSAALEAIKCSKCTKFSGCVPLRKLHGHHGGQPVFGEVGVGSALVCLQKAHIHTLLHPHWLSPQSGSSGTPAELTQARTGVSSLPSIPAPGLSRRRSSYPCLGPLSHMVTVHRSTDGMLQCPAQGALDTQEPKLQLAPTLLAPRPTSSPPGPSWGLGWTNATAPEGLRLMARKWPDNPTGGW